MMTLNCPCGHAVSAHDEDELVEMSRAHLREAHPERSYTREQILFFADLCADREYALVGADRHLPPSTLRPRVSAAKARRN